MCNEHRKNWTPIASKRFKKKKREKNQSFLKLNSAFECPVAKDFQHSNVGKKTRRIWIWHLNARNVQEFGSNAMLKNGQNWLFYGSNAFAQRWDEQRIGNLILALGFER